MLRLLHHVLASGHATSWAVAGLMALVGCLSCASPSPPPLALRSAAAIEVVSLALAAPDERASAGFVASGDPGSRIRWRAGFVLSSPHPRFGGFSGLLVEGDRLLAISDRGWWWSSSLELAADGTLTGFSAGSIAPILDLDGSPVTGRDRHDAEELARWRQWQVVSFEGQHRLHAYHGAEPFALDGPAPRLIEGPPMNGLEDNLGLEAITHLADGRLLLIAEGASHLTGHLQAWVSAGDGDPRPDAGGEIAMSWRPLALETTGELRPTAAALLPGGDVLLVQRSYSPREGVRIGIYRIDGRHLDEAALEAGRVIVPVELARLSAPMPIDNMEAVDVTRGPGGETLIYLLADDNFNDTQKTLLLQLELGS